jgi:hypothetical protein
MLLSAFPQRGDLRLEDDSYWLRTDYLSEMPFYSLLEEGREGDCLSRLWGRMLPFGQVLGEGLSRLMDLLTISLHYNNK